MKAEKCCWGLTIDSYDMLCCPLLYLLLWDKNHKCHPFSYNTELYFHGRFVVLNVFRWRLAPDQRVIWIFLLSSHTNLHPIPPPQHKHTHSRKCWSRNSLSTVKSFPLINKRTETINPCWEIPAIAILLNEVHVRMFCFMGEYRTRLCEKFSWKFPPLDHGFALWQHLHCPVASSKDRE